MLVENFARVQTEIAAACQRAGRDARSVTLVAVSKLHSPQAMLMAYQAGVRHFGENRVEEAAPKKAAFLDLLPKDAPPPTWHMIGHIQSRKAQAVIETFDVIHAVDSWRLAERIDRLAADHNARPTIMLQINISGEESKAGLGADQWETSPTQRQTLWEVVESISHLTAIHAIGLMTMAPYVAEPEATRPVFAGLRCLRDALAVDFPTMTWDALSMGMTNDYPVAIEEGATHVRIGRAIFGETEKGY
ncbi:MAG: YggS family pyridoxal phosphate-dependent enzyme [Anaerolineales bacterium]|nr:YggS family pyridoxal phosphate-dependent enzyme [Anaerolineales bacterium]